MISQQEFIARQERLLGQLPPNSICVVAAATLCTRSNDTEYPFRQNSDFWYLTGFNEPDAYLLLSNHPRYDDHYRAMIVRPTDPSQEIWHGRRLGVDAAEREFSLDDAYSSDVLDEVLLTHVDGHTNLYFALGEIAHADEVILPLLEALRSQPRQHQAPPNVCDYRPMLHEMRLFKSACEVATMRAAAEISAAAHCRAMQACNPGKYEYQLAAELHYAFAQGGALHPAYGTIVGGGINACILHYTENTAVLNDGDLVLIDAGGEYQGYAADITRTFPVNGTFTPEQKAVYSIVLEAQMAVLEMLKPGVTIAEALTLSARVITQGLIKLGLLEGDLDELMAENAWRRFYMHGVGHYLGLDVHDVGKYKIDGKDRPLQPGMVITIEPGVYIADDDDIPEQYRGIGVRIEDNVVITADGIDVLTAGVPKTIDEIEALMAQGGQ